MAEPSFTLEFPRRAMDDVLKSLTVLSANATVSAVAFETPADAILASMIPNWKLRQSSRARAKRVSNAR